MRVMEVWRQLAIYVLWPGTAGLVASAQFAVIKLVTLQGLYPRLNDLGNPDFRISNIRPFDEVIGFGGADCLEVLY